MYMAFCFCFNGLDGFCNLKVFFFCCYIFQIGISCSDVLIGLRNCFIEVRSDILHQCKWKWFQFCMPYVCKLLVIISSCRFQFQLYIWGTSFSAKQRFKKSLCDSYLVNLSLRQLSLSAIFSFCLSVDDVNPK